MTADVLLSAVPAAALLLLGGVVYARGGDLMRPGVVIAAYWGLVLLGSLVFAPEYNVWAPAAWLILVWVLFCCLGETLGLALAVECGASKSVRCRQVSLRSGRLLKPILSASVLLGIASVLLMLRSQGLSLLVFTRPRMLAQVAHGFSVARYGTGHSPSLALRLLQVFVYLAPLLGGVWVATANSGRESVWGLVSLLPVVMQGTAQASRAGILLSVLFFGSTYLACGVLKTEPLRVRRSLLLKAVFLLVGLLALFVGLQTLRLGRLDQRTLSTSVARVRPYLMGQYSVLSQWLSDNWHHSQPVWGRYSVAGVFDMLGVAAREQGVYRPEYHLHGRTGPSPNIYTAFRGLVEDFSLIGSLVAAWSGGVLAGFAYRSVVGGRRAWVPLLAAAYSVIGYSYIVSLWTYNSTLVAYVLLLIAWPRLLRVEYSADVPQKSMRELRKGERRQHECD